jgi:ferric-dicitrate binding protein FerR (iron transport regulator)
MNRRLSDLQLERYLAEALSPQERAAVDQVLASSAPDAEALRVLRTESAALFVTSPPAAFVEKVMPAKKSPWRGWLGALSAIAAAAALLLVVRNQRDDDDTRVKGGIGWHVTVTGQTGTRTLMERTVVTPGETLSFEVATERQVFVAVISHAPDGWWVYAPASGTGAVRVERGLTLLPDGAKLDETEGDETVYLVSSDEPFEPEKLRDSMKNNVTPNGISVEPIPIVKRRK